MNNTRGNSRRYYGYVPAVKRSDSALNPTYQGQDELDKVFGGVFRGLLSPWVGGPSREDLASLLPNMDVTSTDKAYDVTVEVPGVDPEMVTVEVKDDMLVIRGEKRQEAKQVNPEEMSGETDEAKASKSKVHVSERFYGSFERAVTLPEDADTDNISASCKNGVLHIAIPRKAPAVPQAKTITISKE